MSSKYALREQKIIECVFDIDRQNFAKEKFEILSQRSSRGRRKFVNFDKVAILSKPESSIHISKGDQKQNGNPIYPEIIGK